jgi:enoyl-CoA hydratase/carnithine racemase
VTASPDAAAIVVSRSGGCVTIEIARPAKRNALRPAEWTALTQALVEIGQEPAARAVVLTGQGGNFSGGFDLRATAAPGAPSTLPAVHRAILEMHRLPKPTIAAVEGACVGAGWALALACDLVVAAEGAYFQPPYASRGLMPDAGIAWFLGQSLGRQEINRLLFLDGRYEAREAASRGLVSEVVPDGDALARSLELAERLADLPGATVAVAKAASRRASASSLEAALEGEEFEVALNSAHPDTMVARDRFMAWLGAGRGHQT